MSEPAIAVEGPRKPSFFTKGLGVALALATLLGLPALWGGFFGDELSQLAALEGRAPGSLTRWNLWRFQSGDPAKHAQLVRDGLLFWWTEPHRKMAFWRPLSSVLYTAQYALFHRDAAPYHAVSLLLSLLVIVVVGLLYRRLFSERVAAFAVVLFAVQGAHWEATGQICASHLLLSTLACGLGLLAYVRFREEAYRPGLPLALLGFAVGLACSEAALQTIAFVLAYELAGATDGLRKRALALAPVVVMVLAYVAAHTALGYGARGIEGYADPLTEPRGFLHIFASRLFTVAQLLLALLDGFPGSFGTANHFKTQYGSPLYTIRVPLVVAVLAAVAGLYVLLRRCPPEVAPKRDVAAARWLWIGALLAIVPAFGAQAGPRLLLVPGIGMMPAFVLLLRWAWLAASKAIAAAPWVRWSLVGLGVPLFLAQAVVSPILLPLNLVHRGQANEEHNGAVERLVLGGTEGQRPDDDVLVLASPVFDFAEFAAALPRARPWLILSKDQGAQEVLRTGSGAMELSGRRPSSPPSPSGYPKAGDVIPLRGGLELTVLETSGTDDVLKNRPVRVALRSQRPLDDPTFRFLAFSNGSLRRVDLPAIGGRLSLPAVESAPF